MSDAILVGGGARLRCGAARGELAQLEAESLDELTRLPRVPDKTASKTQFKPLGGRYMRSWAFSCARQTARSDSPCMAPCTPAAASAAEGTEVVSSASSSRLEGVSRVYNDGDGTLELSPIPFFTGDDNGDDHPEDGARALNENASIEESAREREAAAFAAELARLRRGLERAAGDGNERELDREELVADAETVVAESLRLRDEAVAERDAARAEGARMAGMARILAAGVASTGTGTGSTGAGNGVRVSVGDDTLETLEQEVVLALEEAEAATAAAEAGTAEAALARGETEAALARAAAAEEMGAVHAAEAAAAWAEADAMRCELHEVGPRPGRY